MVATPDQARIIARLGLSGTLLEQFVLTPGAISDPEGLIDSPSLMRFAMDVQRVMATEGWIPPRSEAGPD